MDVNSLHKINDYLWEIPQQGGMQVPGRIFASEKLVKEMDEKVREQVTNVAMLPGIQIASLAMPDAHWGYGFPIGGVAAFDPDEGGIISMGGVGFDISCGVRTVKTGMTREQMEPQLTKLVDELFRRVPAGVGSEGLIKLTTSQLDEMLLGGAEWAVQKGYGLKQDLEYIEEHGRVSGAQPEHVSPTAKKRQEREMGTLGSGNHYLEAQVVDEIFDKEGALAMGLKKDDVVISIHCGSRGLGHQVGTDYIKSLAGAASKYNLPIRDRELASAPIDSPEGRKYFGAMSAGINCALANRQIITHLVREIVQDIFPEAKVSMLYDISHNTCKVETHMVKGKKKRLYVHRKGATRAFGPGQIDLPKEYQHVGQPVLIGGTMGTASYILAGTDEGMKVAFGSACHGAGRAMSRTQAKRQWKGREVIDQLAAQGVVVRGHSYSGIAEEAPESYKDVTEVVDAAHYAGLARKVAKVKPWACVKG
ncbi:MAG: RNA-splicing ligase RtcB [Nitrospirae bacterium GWC2_57_13]|nr:MAG: RNA-splicing ligase RtcB [Nitrospirae bacterium GWC2_57_13]